MTSEKLDSGRLREEVIVGLQTFGLPVSEPERARCALFPDENLDVVINWDQPAVGLVLAKLVDGINLEVKPLLDPKEAKRVMVKHASFRSERARGTGGR